MNAYIYVTYASEDRTSAERFCQMLSRYGVRYQSACEQHTAARRAELLERGALLIALTSPAAALSETVASDIRRGLERRGQILCVSLKDNELDRRFCAETEERISFIRYPAGETPDRHTVALFIHRLFVRHLAARAECFSPERCTEDLYGDAISCAYRAHSGDGDACFELGRAYEQGVGVPALDVEAAFWMQKAADRLVHDGLICMGLYRLWGKGVERDPKEAFRLFSLAARDGDERGEYHCGLCFLTGNGVMRDPSFGVECLKRAADAGYAPALYRLALAARDGEGMPADGRAAIRGLYAALREIMPRTREGKPLLSLYGRSHGKRYVGISMRQMRRRLSESGAISCATHKHASEGGYAPSLCRALRRISVRSTDYPEDRWHTHPISTLGEEHADRIAALSVYERRRYEDDYTPSDAAATACELGKLLESGDALGIPPAPARALVWYRFSVRLGSAEAAYRLGDAYRRGVGTVPCPRRARELYRLAAERGDRRGQFALAACMERGFGTDADLFEAARLYAAAAENGYAPAQNNLGGCYEHGRGVAQNQLTAVEWYARAAAAGLPESICRLGLCYEYGRGVTADMARAVSLYRTAAEAGHPYAHYRLALCYDHGVNHESLPPTEAMATHVTTPYEERVRFADMETEGEETTLEAEVFPAETAAGEEICIPADAARAVRLYRKAAEGGIPEAHYALYLCLRDGRGVLPHEGEALSHLVAAAEKGHIQASCELGLSYMEGQVCPRDQKKAVACFTRAAEAWRTLSEALRYKANAPEREAGAVGAMSMRDAAGTALYMLGYCALYGLGEEDCNRAVLPAHRPSPERVGRAAEWFREAAETDHVGALTMLGDLYAYGLMPSRQASEEDEALRYYLEAVRVGTNQPLRDTYHSRRYGSSPVDALMTLAGRASRAAEERLAEDDAGGAELAWVNVWHSFSEAAEYGSADALIGMAESLFFGRGAPANGEAALRLLRRAGSVDGGRVVASLRLGDCMAAGREADDALSEEVAAMYREGLQIRPLESECGPYTLGLRRGERLEADRRARAELLYRLAIHSVLSSGREKEGFVYLAEAIRMEHSAALEDLSRMYGQRTDALSNHPSSASEGRKTNQKSGKTEESCPMSVDMGAYYRAVLPAPLPFSYGMRSRAQADSLPAYTTAEVTASMTVDALYYLGECYYYGYGLQADAGAAVECYRRALGIPLAIPRGTPPPASVTQAAYSLGWCLLNGVGAERDETEAVKWLTAASSRHGAACAALGHCYEQGLGVMAADDREAIKYYRKALRLGHRSAARKVSVLEKRLKSAAEQS